MDDDHENRPTAAGGDRRELSLVRGEAGAPLHGPGAPSCASLRREPWWAPARVKELQGTIKTDAFADYRRLLGEEILFRFGPQAAAHLEARLGFASGKTVMAWYRRASFMLCYPELLDPVPIAVTYITPQLLLKHAFGPAIEKSAVLVRFQRGRDPQHDAWDLRVRAPWFWDLPEPDLAIQRLRCDGWLLLACDDDRQAALLVGTARESKRLTVREIVPARIACEREGNIVFRYLGPVGDFNRCLR
jgi:hypothetical protein